MRLEAAADNLSPRVIDLMTPVGKSQRAVPVGRGHRLSALERRASPCDGTREDDHCSTRTIARLYHAGTLRDGTPWLATEHVDGASLTQYCAAHELTVTGRLRLFRQISEAVRHAHEQLIVHRDLRPSNVLVTRAFDIMMSHTYHPVCARH